MKDLEQRIGAVLAAGLPGDGPALFATEVGAAVAAALPRQVNGSRRSFSISPSNYGSPCIRKLWLQSRDVEGESLQPAARVKFMYGDMIEALAVPLIKAAGYEVTDVKRKYSWITPDGIDLRGEGDLVVGGQTCDVKSMSKYSFNDWNGGSEDDKFGYIWQLSAYDAMRHAEDGTESSGSGAIIGVHKELGHIAGFERGLRSADEVAIRLRSVHQSVDDSTPPDRLPDEPEGASGNRKLGIACSYCEFKRVCWPEARTFLYAGNRPVMLTKVERLPKVPEITNES